MSGIALNLSINPMKTILIIALLLMAGFCTAQDSVKTDSVLINLKAKYAKLQKEYFDFKDELMRYEGRLQMLEVLIREEELRVLSIE